VLNLGPGEKALEAWHAYLWERVWVRRGFHPPHPTETQFREGFLLLTNERLAFLVKPVFLERNWEIGMGLRLNSNDIRNLEAHSEDLTVDRWNFRMRGSDIGAIASRIQQVMAQSNGQPQAFAPIGGGVPPVAGGAQPDAGGPQPDAQGSQPDAEDAPAGGAIPGVTTEDPRGNFSTEAPPPENATDTATPENATDAPTPENAPETAAPVDATGSAPSADSGQMTSCPECHQLTTTDQGKCTKCGADLTWMQ
jgi:hypothetical protein